MIENILEISHLTKTFGGLNAVSDVNISIKKGELIGLIGPNGAGKTTVFNLITGVYRPNEGSILLDGKSIGGLAPHIICKNGIARTFQNIRLFKELTVLDNVKIAFHKEVNYTLLEAVLRGNRFYRGEDDIEEKALGLLEIFGLKDKRDELACNLPYGEQRRLEIARALATDPKLLILDEPAAGMNPQETQALTELIRWVRLQFNLSILLIEHDMSLVMGLCERLYVLNYGQILATGLPEEIRNNKEVITAYLGEEVEKDVVGN